jgi:hypothetical protein
MRFFRIQTAVLAASLLAAAAFFVSTTAPVAHTQTNITGALAGTVTDSTGANVPGATVTATSVATGSSQVVQASVAGDFRISQLAPGVYSVSVKVPGFETAKQTVMVSVNTVATVDFKLEIGKTSTTVEVRGGEVPLLHVEDAQVSTQFTLEQIENLPNPGNDMTFVAQTAAGSVMNTQGGYGNFSSFGLPSTANTFTINGGYDNDPFLNVNNSGATNLLLGANDVDTETVTSNAYNASFGGLGGAQVSQVSRSGSNQFHGNAAYQWNGRAMNANDFFNKLYGNPRSFDNANQYAASVGGPIKHNKAFFFVNYEGLKVVLPSRATINAPDPTYQSTVLANLTANGLASEIPEYKAIFGLYNNAPGYASGSETTVPDGYVCAPYCTYTFNGTAGNYTHEWLMNPRIDLNLTDKDHLFGHGTIDKGLQATFTSVLNPLFDVASSQPSYEGQIGETHTFSPSLTNQFLTSLIYYVAVFSNANATASEKIVPFDIAFTNGNLAADNAPSGYPGAASPGGINFAFPQGRNVTGYTFQDDLSWTKGKHTLSTGWTMRRDDITDYSPSEYVGAPLVFESTASAPLKTTDPTIPTSGPLAGQVPAQSFENGFVDTWDENFPTRTTQPVALYAMGWYGQDQWKVRPNLIVTYGLRMEHNSDPICRTDCFAHLSGDFASVSTNTSTAYDQLIDANLFVAMPKLQMIGLEPRLGFSYLPFGSGSKTTIRGGFGIFDDAFPGVIADDLLNNAPTNVPFSILGPAHSGPNYLLVPGTTCGTATANNPNACTAGVNSAQASAAASGAAFHSDFASGGSLNSISAAVPAFSAPSVVNPVTQIKNPTYEEWSLAIEHQIDRFDSFQIMYVGNHSYHEPELNNSINVYNAINPNTGEPSAAGFPELLTANPPNPNFGVVNEISSSANGNFNGFVVSAQHRSGSLTATVNYQWSHALDEVSNGGFSPFSGNSENPGNPFNLRQNYGNADYDVRQYVSGSYVYSMPHFGGPKLLVDNWQFSGTVFHTTGYPFSVVDGATAENLSYYGGPLYAMQTASINGATHCGGYSVASGATTCAFTADYGTATDFSQSRRNQTFGPNYTDSDFSVTKGFTMPHWDTGKLRVGAEFYNVFNHPNFAQPLANTAYGSYFGTIQSGVNPPTSILGSFLGGDASPRLIQLTGKFNF